MSRQITLIGGAPQEFYEVANFLRILAASAPLTIEFYNQGREVAEAVNVSKGYAEKFDLGTFDRVRLVSDTTQDVQLVTRLGNTVQYDAAPVGDTAIVSSVPLALDLATQNALNRPSSWSGSYIANSALAADTAEAVFLAASNVNGAIIHSMEAKSYPTSASAWDLAYLAKATPPATVVDGVLLAKGVVRTYNGSNSFMCEVESRERIFVPPGLGVFFISQQALSLSQGGLRGVRYEFL